MDAKIMNDLMHFLQNSEEGKKITAESNLQSEELSQVAQEILPKITSQLSGSNEKLKDLLAIIAQNKDDPESMLNENPGFDVNKAENEGGQILQSLFGNSKTDQIVEGISQKTGIDSTQINAILPMLTAFTTKVLSGKASPGDNTDGTGQSSYLQQIVGVLDTNKDGSVMDDLFRMGQQFISNWFNREKK